MAYHMACSNVPWLSAIGPVAGVIPQAACEMAHPVSLIAFNGAKDPIVAYDGRLFMWSVPASVANYARGIGCQKNGHTGYANGDVVETIYLPCRSGAEVRLYTVTDGGHTWPGGFPLDWAGLGKTTYVINASSLMYDFFMAHPLMRGGHINSPHGS
jgi:polyhydroxybutyrate depolymerase